MDAALAVINLRGFDACSIEDITELADVGKGTFYRHFKDKSAVLRDLLELAIDDLLTRTRARHAQAASLDMAVAAVLGAQAEAFGARPDLFLLFLQAGTMAAVHPTARHGLEVLCNGYFGEVEQMLTPFLPVDTNAASRRRLSCATSAAVGGYVTAALSDRKMPQEIAADLKPVTQAFLAGVPGLLRPE